MGSTRRRLNVREVSVRFGPTEAVDNVSFSLGPGDVLGLVGESGSGKTTLCKAIAGILQSSAVATGVVDMGGVSGSLTREFGRRSSLRIGYVFQSPGRALNPCLRIGTQLTEHIEPIDMPQREKQHRAREMLRRMRISEPDRVMDRYPHEISGGQQQRVCIAIALLNSPEVLILDEPTTNLDVTTQAALLVLIREILAETPVPSVYVSHDLRVVEEVVNRVAVMLCGRVLEIGPVEEVFAEPLHPYTRQLMASLPQIGSHGVRAFGVTSVGSSPGKRRNGHSETSLAPAVANCPYLYRCPLAEDSCATSDSSLRRVTSVKHLVRCRRAEGSGSIPIHDTGERPKEQRRPGDVVIAGRELSVTYGNRHTEVRALSKADIELREGWTVGVVGESGAGKSTLGRALLGLVPIEAGELFLDGERLDESVANRSRHQLSQIQMVFQSTSASLNPRRTVGSILSRVARQLRGMTKNEVREYVRGLLCEVELSEEFYDRYPDQLSCGQQQRVSIARALAGDPTTVILDEAVSALDVTVQAKILGLLRRIQDRDRLSFMLISHDLAVIAGFADEIVTLFRGKMVERGLTQDVMDGPHHPYTEVLFRSIPGGIPLSQRAVSLLDAPDSEFGACVFSDKCPWRVGSVCLEVDPPARHPTAGHTFWCHRDETDLWKTIQGDRRSAIAESKRAATA